MSSFFRRTFLNLFYLFLSYSLLISAKKHSSSSGGGGGGGGGNSKPKNGKGGAVVAGAAAGATLGFAWIIMNDQSLPHIDKINQKIDDPVRQFGYFRFSQFLVMKRGISWSGGDFYVVDGIYGLPAYKVTRTLGSKLLGQFEITLYENKTTTQMMRSGYNWTELSRPGYNQPAEEEMTRRFKLRVNSPPPNTSRVWCGFSQTYKTDDGAQIRFRTRGVHSDQWLLKKGGPIDQEYTWHRHTHHMTGKIKISNDTVVADISSQRFLGSDFFHTKWANMATYTFASNGTFDNVYLVAMYAASLLRLDQCVNY